jgi:hypothetical protein
MPRYEDVTLKQGTLKRIHVNQFIIKRFHKTGEDEPAWIIRTSQGTYYARSWEVSGPVTGIQSLAKPMPGCSARMWIETRDEIVLRQAEVAPAECEVAA